MQSYTEKMQQEMLTVRKKREELVRTFEEHERAYYNRLKELDASLNELQKGIWATPLARFNSSGKEWNIEHERVIILKQDIQKLYE